MSFNDIQNNVIYNENANYKVTAYGDVVFGDDESDRHSLSDGLIEMGVDGRPSEPILVLSSRGGNKIGAIQNVRSINITHPLSDVAELSFDVYKEIDGVTYKDWDKIKDFKFIQMPHDNNWFEAKVTLDEENEIIKHVTCVHANEAELGQLNLYEVEINTDADIERDDYEETFFYNEDNPKASLLHRILSDKAPHYQIYHVDDTLKGLWRQFSFNVTSIQDALNQIAGEVGCLFVYGEWSENDGKYHRTISAYDLEDYCYHCGKRGNYSEHVCTNCGSTNINYGYGEDTGIFISRENLATSINYESNTDNVKNCFRLVAGDDVMTAAIKSCNPSMSQYIWYFSDDMLEDMSAGLRNKVVEYQNLVSDYQTTQSMNVSGYYINNYNSLVTKYSDYNDELVTIDYPIIGTAKLTEAYYDGVNLYGFIKSELMPASEKVESTTALDQLEILQTGGNMSEVGIPSVSGTIPYTTANSAIQSYAKVYIDTSRYKVTVFTYDIVGTAWSGEITIQSYTDDEDSATAEFEITLFDSSSNEKYAKWLNQSVQKTMANREVTDLSVVKLFNTDETLQAFKTRIQGYSLDYLSIMDSMATSAITILTEQGIANEGSTNTDIYTQLYKPYLDKSRAIQTEIAVKEKELSYLQRPTDDEGNTDPRYPELGLLDVIVIVQNDLSKLLDMHTYLGDELWTELSFYRREDEYQNSNYISDGLTDGEIIEQAQRFVESANKEIIKASTLQHTISAPLIDFLIMPEFIKLQRKFKTGNWIHLEVDGNVYKLRLTNWTIDFDSIEDLDVEFSDVIRVGGSISDIASILSKSRSMATTYDYTAKQAIKGKDASETIKIYKDYGIDFRKIKAITSKGNTNIVYDDDGILLKRVDGTETLPEQARIYNNGIYITKDAWETVSTGLGHYSYVDPETGQTIETYGIIADTVIGKLILGENLKIYSESGKFEMGDNGLVITAKDGEDNTDLFVVQKEMEDEQGRTYVEKYIYVDSNGDVKIAGNSVVIGGKPLVEYIDDAVEEKGDTAQWYYGDSLTHTSGTATLPVSQTDDVAVGAMYLNTKTGMCYKCTAISGSNVTWEYAGNITDGINIGGRNLWMNTLSPDVSSPNNYPRMVGQTDYTRVASAANNDVAIAEHGIKNIVKKAGKRPRFDFGLLTSTNGFEVGQTYTVSFDWSAKLFSSDTDTTTKYLGFYIYDNHTGSNKINEDCTNRFFTITTDLKGVEQTGRMEFTFTTAESATIIRISIMGNADAGQAVGDYFELRNMKLEKGNKATDWTPAPEDIDAEISTKADSSDAVSEEQLIYISKASGTLSVDGTTTWITENGDVQNTWSTKRPTYDTNYPVLFIAKQRKTVSGTVSCTTPLKDDTTTIIDGGHITTGTIDASQVAVTNINASNISTGTLSADRIGTNSIDASKINVSSISIGDLSGASNYAQKTDIGWCVLINVSAIDFINNTATLHASVYKDGTIQSSGFTLQWYKTTTSTDVTPEVTTTTAISGATSDVLSVIDLNASYTCIVN